MPASPLVAYHETAINDHKALAVSAQGVIDSAQPLLAAAEAAAKDAVDAIAKKLDERKVVQAKLALATSPAEVAPLAAQLEAILLELHHQQALLLSARTAIVTHTADIARAESRLRRARAGIAAFTESKAQAEVRSAQEETWKAVLASPAFTGAVADATAQWNDAPKTTPNYVDAQVRVEGDIPAPILAAARDRATAALATAAAAKAAVATVLTSLNTRLDADGGLAAQVEKLTIAFEAARATIRDRATRRLESLERALALLQGVVSSPALTESETDAIAVFTAAWTAKKAELDEAISNSDPQNVIDALQAELDAITDDPRWEAAVPDRAWQNLDAFEEATRILTEVTTADGTPMSTVFDDAETALAAKLAQQLTNTLERAALAEDLVAARVKAERAAAPELIFSALRGDE